VVAKRTVVLQQGYGSISIPRSRFPCERVFCRHGREIVAIDLASGRIRTTLGPAGPEIPRHSDAFRQLAIDMTPLATWLFMKPDEIPG
jgi:hypothetical protein